ncbi:hypothetical protein [Aliarcobacter butzleri]|nr:hypothetical protein [Aliarcobacter butzleri]
MRQIHVAGEKLFIDFSGMTMNVVDKDTGEINKVQIFVAVLGVTTVNGNYCTAGIKK